MQRVELVVRTFVPNLPDPVGAGEFENNLCCLNANLGGLGLVANERHWTLKLFVGVSLRRCPKLPCREIERAFLPAPSTLSKLRSASRHGQ
jgi:hypothetical protein